MSTILFLSVTLSDNTCNRMSCSISKDLSPNLYGLLFDLEVPSIIIAGSCTRYSLPIEKSPLSDNTNPVEFSRERSCISLQYGN